MPTGPPGCHERSRAEPSARVALHHPPYHFDVISFLISVDGPFSHYLDVVPCNLDRHLYVFSITSHLISHIDSVKTTPIQSFLFRRIDTVSTLFQIHIFGCYHLRMKNVGSAAAAPGRESFEFLHLE